MGSLVLGLVATIYLVVAILLAGVNLLMMCCILYIPGMVAYLMACREYKRKPFERWELVLAIVLMIIAAVTIYLLATGVFTI